MQSAASGTALKIASQKLNEALAALCCQKCSRPLSSPMTLTCGDTFCRGCVVDMTGKTRRCPACNDVVKMTEAIPNTTLENLLSDLLSCEIIINAQPCLASPNPSSARRSSVAEGRSQGLHDRAICETATTIKQSCTPLTMLPPSTEGRLYRCEDYISVRNALSYEMSQEIMSQIIANDDITREGNEGSRDSPEPDGWTENPEIHGHIPAEAYLSRPSYVSTRLPFDDVTIADEEAIDEEAALGSIRHSCKSQAPTLTPEIALIEYEPGRPSKPDCAGPVADSLETNSKSPHARECNLKDNAPEFVSVAASIETVLDCQSYIHGSGQGMDLSPEIPIRPNGQEDGRSNGEKEEGHPTLSSANSDSWPNLTRAIAELPVESYSRLLTPQKVPIGAHIETSTPKIPASLSPNMGLLTSSDSILVSNTIDASLDAWGLQIRQELKEMKRRLQRADDTIDKDRIRKMHKSGDDSELEGADASHNYRSPSHSETISNVKASPAPLNVDLTEENDAMGYSDQRQRQIIECRVAAQSLEPNSFRWLEECRNKGYIEFGDLVMSAEKPKQSGSDRYNVMVVDCAQIVQGHKLCMRSVMYVKAVCVGACIVSSDWLRDMLESGAFLSPEKYEISGSTHDRVTGGPTSSRISLRNTLGQLALLDGVVFQLHLESPSSSSSSRSYRLSEGEVRWIIFFCGGHVQDGTESDACSQKFSDKLKVHLVRNNKMDSGFLHKTGCGTQENVHVLTVNWLVNVVCTQEFFLPSPSYCCRILSGDVLVVAQCASVRLLV